MKENKIWIELLYLMAGMTVALALRVNLPKQSAPTLIAVFPAPARRFRWSKPSNGSVGACAWAPVGRVRKGSSILFLMILHSGHV